MTPTQKTLVHEKLRTYGRTDARSIARALSYPLESVYEALVSLESRGMCRVEVTYSEAVSNGRTCEWVAA